MRVKGWVGGGMLLAAVMILPSAAAGATLYQCVHKETGAARYVSPGTACLPSESSLILSIPVVVHGSVINGNAYTNGAIGFTYTEPQPGQYVITFSGDPLASAPDCVADIINPPANRVAYCDTINTTLSPSSVAVACHQLDAQTGLVSLLDWDFTFMCIL